VANTAWAFATLGVQAPALFDAVDKHGDWLVTEGTPQAVANTVWAFATLGVKASSLFDAVDNRSDWLVKKGNPQNVANTVWAAAVLGLLGKNANLVRLCWNSAMALDLSKFTAKNLTQLHEVERCVQIEGSDELQQSLLPMPQELRDAVDKAVASNELVSSRHHLEASKALTTIGFAHENEVSPFEDGSEGDGGFMAIDMACRDRMLAIEFNGPSHYNSDGGLNGKTMMKKRLLEKLGWKLHMIPWWEWRDLKGEGQKAEYLSRKLGE
jgi:hypothetical protein